VERAIRQVGATHPAELVAIFRNLRPDEPEPTTTETSVLSGETSTVSARPAATNGSATPEDTTERDG
jgi:hypothetical protein